MATLDRNRRIVERFTSGNLAFLPLSAFHKIIKQEGENISRKELAALLKGHVSSLTTHADTRKRFERRASFALPFWTNFFLDSFFLPVRFFQADVFTCIRVHFLRMNFQRKNLRSFQCKGFLMASEGISKSIFVEFLRKTTAEGTKEAFKKIVTRHKLLPGTVTVDDVSFSLRPLRIPLRKT